MKTLKPQLLTSDVEHRFEINDLSTDNVMFCIKWYYIIIVASKVLCEESTAQRVTFPNTVVYSIVLTGFSASFSHYSLQILFRHSKVYV